MKEEYLSIRRSRLSNTKQALLEQRLRGRLQNRCLKRTEAIQKRPTEQRIPLSFSQQGVWFFQLLQPSSTVYNVCSAARIEGSLDIKVLKSCLQRIIERHDSLRTIFRVEDDQPYQHLHSRVRLPLRILDLTDTDPEVQEAKLQNELKAEADTPFDIETGPLVRFVVYTLGNMSHVFSVTMQHIITDGWSFNIFFKELSILYENHMRRSSPNLTSLQIGYGDFAYWQRNQWVNSAQYEMHIQYWKNSLSGTLPLLQLATDYQRPSVISYQGDSVYFNFDENITGKLKDYCKAKNVTLFMLLLAAFRVFLYRYTDQSDIVIGFPVANRSRKETEGLIGDFINTIALRTVLSSEYDFDRVLESVKKDTLNA